MARSIKENIILSFVVFSLISMVLVGTISIIFVGVIGQTTTTMSTQSLKSQIQDNIEQTAIQNALIINKKLSNAEAMVLAMAEECENLFNETIPYTTRTSYYDYFFEYDRDQKLFPNDTYLDSKYGVYLSWSYASYYFPGSNSTNYKTLLANNPSLNDTISRMAHMDYIFKNIHENAPDFRWLYIAFETTDLFINYPGSVVGGTDADRQTDPFKATQEDWYKEVRQGNGKVVFTAPYFDPIDGALLITIGKAIFNPQTKALIGCIFADLTIESIKEKILNINVLESGYAALIQTSGLVVAHPEWIATNPNVDLPTIDQVEINSNGQSALTASQISIITAGSSTGVIEYTRNNKNYYMAYTNVGKGDYICLIVVPEEEALAAVTPLQSRIEAVTITSIIQVIIILVIAVVASITMGVWLSSRIITPINRLTQIASKMATDKIREDLLADLDVEIDKELEQQDDEVGELTRAFKGMLNALKQESKKDVKHIDESFWD